MIDWLLDYLIDCSTVLLNDWLLDHNHMLFSVLFTWKAWLVKGDHRPLLTMIDWLTGLSNWLLDCFIEWLIAWPPPYVILSVVYMIRWINKGDHRPCWRWLIDCWTVKLIARMFYWMIDCLPYTIISVVYMERWIYQGDHRPLLTMIDWLQDC